MYLAENIKGLCDKNNLDYEGFLSDLNVDNANELSLTDLEIICEEYQTDLYSLIFNRVFKTKELDSKLKEIKLLVLDVDGVMTDGGMYFAESGDQMKKYNTKDGMAILELTKNDFKVAIISSGFKAEGVKKRAEMLGIQFCSVSRNPKLETLNGICAELNIGLNNVAIIGDDVNDLEVMNKIGLSVCPSDSVHEVKKVVDIVLNKKGGEGCVREFIDHYLLNEPING